MFEETLAILVNGALSGCYSSPKTILPLKKKTAISRKSCPDKSYRRPGPASRLRTTMSPTSEVE
jgi:hypothetical protein